MANERFISLDAVIKKLKDEIQNCKPVEEFDEFFTEYKKRVIPKLLQDVINYLEKQPIVDAVEVDTVIEMFEYMLGDCPCNFSPVDEWLAEQCELQEECPNPADKRGCWKQFIKHFCAKMDGE